MKNAERSDLIHAAAPIFALSMTPEEAELATDFVAELEKAVRARREAFSPPLTRHPATVYRPFTPPSHPPAHPRGLLPEARDAGATTTPPQEALPFLTLTRQIALLDSGALRPTALLEAVIARLEAVNPAINAIVTRSYQAAREHARRLEEEVDAAAARGDEPGRPDAALLWGIPYGAKDLFDTAGLVTTFGAEPYRNNVPRDDAAVIAKLRQAGAVMTVKTSLGELAMGDQWFGGRTNNPWNTEAGSSGSSAGSAAAVAAGALPFALGTETSGSIISPSLTCGVVGLRPTFGRVSRAGAMPLSWGFDKIGPITRHPRDAAVVFSALVGRDPADPDSVDSVFPSREDLRILQSAEPGFRLGYMPRWFDEKSAGNSAEKESVGGASALKSAVMDWIGQDPRFSTREVRFPDLPYRNLAYLLLADSAAAFEELTVTDRDDLLSRQDPDSWASTFRAAHFISAVEYVQLQRLRSHCLDVLEEIFAGVDMLISPAYADSGSLLVLTTATGHPSVTFPIGFTSESLPDSLTLWGRPFEEAKLLRTAELIMERFNLGGKWPPVG